MVEKLNDLMRTAKLGFESLLPASVAGMAAEWRDGLLTASNR